MVQCKSSSYFLVLVVAVAAVSNVSAQCFYAANNLASSAYVPCGSTSSGQQQSCCHLGDNCLAFGTCFSPSTKMTYIAGCTDSSYQDGTCGAQICNKKTQIQGIAMPCVQGTWQCCKGNGQRGDNPVFTDASSCKCDENADPVIQGQSGFALTAILPQSANGQIALIDSGGQTTGFIPVPSALPPSLPTPSSLSSSSATDLSAASSTSSYYATTITITPIPFSTSVSSISSSTNTASQVAATTSLSTSSASTTDATTTSSNNGANLRLILGISMPIILVLLAGLAFLAFRAYRHRRQSKRNSFNEGGWDPFRHQPVDRRESRSSAVWDSNYTAAGMADCMRHDDDDDDDDDDNDVAAAVRMNAEAQRKHRRSENGRLRPMSELGGFVSWKGTA